MTRETAREFRVIGPPGTGKTHYITRQCEHAAERYGGSSVVVCSLTRAAAAIAAGAVRDLIPRENIGTLHAMAFRAVGAGRKVAEDHLDAWNEWMGELGHPFFRLSENAAAADVEDATEPLTDKTSGDALMAEMAKLRARMIDRSKWPDSVVPFADLWDRFKSDMDLMDFTDMLEVALRDQETAPGDPAAMLVDESQDLSRLAWSLARKWGERCITFVTVGDPDQLLYHWAGVDVDAFSAVRLPEDQVRVLKQSYRVPREVHRLASQWISKTPGRYPVEYHPTDVEGLVRKTRNDENGNSCAVPNKLIEDAARHVSEGRTVLFATTCAYHLHPVIACLRDAGIPFHNPYRTKRGDWNPIRPSSRGTSAAQRLITFINGGKGRIDGLPCATARELHLVVDWLEGGRTGKALRHGAKALVREWFDADPDRMIDLYDMDQLVFQPDALEAFIDRDLRLLANEAAHKHARQLQFPMRIVERFGSTALEEEPRVIVSTIHGCKGAEADVVYLFPDLSPRAVDEWKSADGCPGKEGIRRTIYVGMTRAKHELVLCAPSGPAAVEWN